ncbi:hypothetical protein C0J52_17134 [Blattella germanica]|nr:hypothetical protein C0J52_17134 [Blattella germanica]
MTYHLTTAKIIPAKLFEDYEFVLIATALASVVAEPPLYLPPGQDPAQFNNQYLPPAQGGHPGGHHGSSSFGQRGAPLSRFSDTSPPSTQYGSLLTPSNRFAGNRNAPSPQYNAPLAQYNSPSSALAHHHNGFQPSPTASPRRNGGRQNQGNQGSGLYAAPLNSGQQYSTPGSQYGAPNGGHSGNINLGAGQFGAQHAHHNGNGGSNQYGPPSGSPSAYNSIHNTPPPPTARFSSAGGSSYANPSGNGDHFGSGSPTQYSIPFPSANAHGDIGRNGAASREYGTPRNSSPAPSGRYAAPQRGSSRYGAPPAGGYNSPRTPSALYDVPAPVYGVASDALQDENSEPANYEFMYEVQDAESGNDFGHMESRQDDDNAQGTYYVVLPDGRKQIILFILASFTLACARPEPPAPGQGYQPAQQRSQPSNVYGSPAEFDRSLSVNSQYGAPSNEYGVPNNNDLAAQTDASARFGSSNTPSSQYGAPDVSSRALTPSNQYGAPAASRSFSSSSSVSSQYGVPSRESSFNAPSSQYGAPASSSRLSGASSQSSQISSSSQFGGASVPSSQYGAPSSSARFGASSSISSQYGAPSPSGRFGGSPAPVYGAPATSARFGASSPQGFPGHSSSSSQFGASSFSSQGHSSSNAVSSQYGAPAQSSRFSGSNSPSTQHGAPSTSSGFGASSFSRSTSSSVSTQYGAPNANGRSRGSSSLSTQYGAPSATNSQYAPGGGYAASRGGYNAQEDALAEPANYQFSYEVKDADSGSDFSQEESRQEDHAQGTYRVLLPDGRLQIVEYVADLEGYKPQIRYEDTGAGAGGYGRGPQQRAQIQGPY